MNTTERIENIVNTMEAFRKDTYHKTELLPEYLKLQQEAVNNTFNEEHADRANLRLWDVVRHFEKLNEERGHVADEALVNFKTGCYKIINEIRAEISGGRGEQKTLEALERMTGRHVILKNIELEKGEHRTELDAVVLTPKGIFIVEVKNTKSDVFIDVDGSYYKEGEFLRYDSSLGSKMDFREELLRELLIANGIPRQGEELKIVKIVVFTNNQIKVHSKRAGLLTCFLGKLPYLIDDYFAPTRFTEEDLMQMAEIIESAAIKECYPTEVDIPKFKQDFATVMTLLEEAAEQEELRSESACESETEGEEEGEAVPRLFRPHTDTAEEAELPKDPKRKPVRGQALKYLGAAAVAVAFISGIALGKRG